MSSHPDLSVDIVSALRRKAAEHPDRLFAAFEGEPLAFGELDRLSDAFAAHLRAEGVGPGDRVAVMLRNSIEAIAVFFGLAKAGAAWVPVNPQQRGPGLAYLIDHCRPSLVVVEAELGGVVRECGADSDPRLLLRGPEVAGGLAEALAAPRTFDEPAPAPAPADTLALMYTSGTTGPPKGVVVTHRMLRIAAEGALVASDGGDGSVYFLWEPLYHVGGAQVLLLPLLRDVRLALVSRFSASRFWRQAREAGATHIHYLGGILQMLLAQDPAQTDRAHGVRVAWGGGCAAGTFEAVRERFGVEIRECYGMTEGSSIATATDGNRAGSIGRALPWFTVTVRDGEDRALPPGERGEIVIESELPGAIFAEYYRNPDATANALRGGALHTGDLGSLDADGELTFHGRLTESLRCRGENVSAWEVEHVVVSHPDVEEAAVIGVAAAVGEQDIKLFAKPRKGASIGPAELSEWLEPRLARYQRPRYIAVVDSFERTPSQRIRKHLLSAATDDIWDRERRRGRSGRIEA
ncbi:class I adenylate-forming enzyme family protein [Leucobacter sp. wl10]|uniref:class I adenylate-forming enzyme family protein n=1 Tax=Leucobacter sp. wl10 TaxID=2304677 RepID=UPI000E5A829B|nr:AMP-binding protein [Leucobacter sp. wl10]RGE24260.1 ATP-dependent acyl-CoA ligase [Leucobacter sp. wl10]